MRSDQQKMGNENLWKFLVFLHFIFFSAFQFPLGNCQVIDNHFTHYTSNDGLADGCIYGGITQDAKGFLWIGSENGLSRFDGKSFKVFRFDPDDSNSLRDNEIEHIFIDSSQRLWVCSNGWLYLYHPEFGGFEHFSFRDLTDDRINTFNYLENGYLILAGQKGLYRFSIKNKIFSTYPLEGIQSDNFADVVKDEYGFFWVSCEKGLIKHDPNTGINELFEFKDIIPADHSEIAALKIILLKDDLLLFSIFNGNGLVLFNRKTHQYKNIKAESINPHPVYKLTGADQIYKQNDSIILCSIGGGLSVFNWRNETSYQINPDKSNPYSLLELNTRIKSFYIDREGILWFGEQGLEKFDFHDFNFTSISPPAHNADSKRFLSYFDLFRCKNGKYLMGSYGGMAIYDPGKDTLFNNDDPYGYYRTSFFNEDCFGKFWCYAKRSVRSFEIKDNKVFNRTDYILPGNPRGIPDLKLGDDGKIYVATWVGLYVFDTLTKRFTIFDANSPQKSRLSNFRTNCLFKDHRGNIWIGTENGINKLEKDHVTIKQFHYFNNGSPVGFSVNAINEDKYGNVWFTTSQCGIGKLDTKNDSIRFFGINHGLPTTKFFDIVVDTNDNLWTYSLMGVVSMNLNTYQTRLFTEKEGFLSPYEIKNIIFDKLSSKVYIFTKYSIIQLDSKNNFNSLDDQPTEITGLTVLNKEKNMLPGQALSLKYNENFININFALLKFHNNEQINYAYKMEGVDKDWIYCNNRRNASYTYLQDGKYIFKVKAQNPDGKWNNPTEITIIISPPFWLTWWFYILETIIGIAPVLWIIRLYVLRKLSQQKLEIEKLSAIANERSRIAFELHDELGAGLTSIRMLSELAEKKIEGNIFPALEIGKIEKSAGFLSENLREIIWTMNTRFDKLDDFIVYVRAFSVEYFEESDMNFKFESPSQLPDIGMQGDLRRNLFLCIKEALHNIIKHSKASNARLSFAIDTSDGNTSQFTLVIEIKDDGIGIAGTNINKFGNGLKNMNERITKFGGRLDIDVNNGTRLLFRVIIK